MKLSGKSKNGIWKRSRPLLTPSNTERMGGPASKAAAPPERKMSRDPMRSLQSMAPHPEKEDTACTANPNQTSSTWPRLVGGIWAPRVSHHLDTALIADPDLKADTALIAEAPCLAGHVTEIPPHTLPGRGQWPKLWDWQKQHLCSHQPRKLQNWSPWCRGCPLPRTTTIPHTIVSTKTPRNSSGTSWETWIGRLMMWRLGAWPPSIHKPQSWPTGWLPPSSPPWWQPTGASTSWCWLSLESSWACQTTPQMWNPLGAPPHSKDYQMDVRVHCIQEWTYLMHLLQYWYDAGLVYTYSGHIRQESKLMLFIFYRINAMLNPHSLFICLHEVMDNTLWHSYYQACTRLQERIADYESHLHIIKRLELLRNWLKNCYLVEATAEWRHLQLYRGSLDPLPFPRSYEEERPGNKGPFYYSRGIHPCEIEPTLENAPQVANAMLEALAWHNCQQSEARDHQEYQWQQDNTESPMANFPSPTPIDRDEHMDLEGLEGTTAAPQLASLTTTAPPLSSSATSVPAKKKVISIEEYNCCKATVWELASMYLNKDENGEDLDYDNFNPQEDPDNILIGYQTPTPLPQIADLPPLQDTTSSATPPTTTLVALNVTIPMPQDSTGPGTVLGTTAHHVATAANWAPGFGRGLPVARALLMQVGTPPISAALMQVTTPAASLYGTPSHALTAEEELLQGTTLPCSPRQEANLLNPLVVLTDNHIRMMDALCHLDSYSLQFICESAEALHRERMPTQAPPGYHMSQVSDIPCGSPNNPPLSQEFYRATSNLWTAIMEPQKVPPQQHPAGNHCPDPEIESAIANMHRHEWASTDSNNNPQWGRGLSCPLASHYTWTSRHLSHPSGIKNRRQKTRNPRLKTIAHWLHHFYRMLL